MKKHLQSIALPVLIMTSATLLLGCEPSPDSNPSAQTQTDIQTEKTSSSDQINDPFQGQPTQTADLKSGNIFYIARDVADVQLKTGDYIQKLQQLQADIQQSIDVQDQKNLHKTAQELNLQLRGFNDALTSLDLKSEEIDSMRQQVLQANQQVLKSPLLNGEMNITKIDFKKIEQQMNSIQMDMLNLANMVLPQSDSNSSESENASQES